MVAIEVQLPQANTPSREGFPRTAPAGACARAGCTLQPPNPTAHPHSCCRAALLTLLIQQKILPNIVGNLVSFMSGFKSTPPAPPEPLRSGDLGETCAQGRTHLPVAAVPFCNLLHKHTHLNRFQVSSSRG